MRRLITNFRWWETGESQGMLVENGRVVSRGANLNAEDAEIVDFGGKTLMPAFIDSHCHILPTGLDLQKLSLAPFSTKAEILDAVRDRHQIEPQDKWLRAVLYDQTKFSDGTHLDRHQLDAISLERPIILRHSNGHASVANTAALTAAVVDESTPDPFGGTFVRDASGSLTGVLLETAHEHVSESGPKVTLDEMVDAILRAGEKMSELGISCASDMMTGRFNLADEFEAYRIAAERGCKVRTRLYLQWSAVFGGRRLDAETFTGLCSGLDGDRCRVAGIKIFADGAIGSLTAGIYGAYEGQPDAPESGTMIYAKERLNQMVRTAHDAGYQISIHSIGDRATDWVMDAYEQVGDAKHRIEHAMILSDSQIERMAGLGIQCTMQPEFLIRFGHAYVRNLGKERATKLKRARSVLDAGIPLSFSSDRPIVSGDPRDGIRTAVNRPLGFEPKENVTLVEAVRAYTSEGAKANLDTDMGSLLPGQCADYIEMTSW